MRILLIAFAAIVLGSATGFGMTWFEFHDSVEYFEPASLSKPSVTPRTETDSGKKLTGPVAVVVGGTKFNFGTLNHDQTREKAFQIRNDGTAPLQVSWSGQSCGMCISNGRDFQPTTVPPGGSCEVIVTYATNKPVSTFSEMAYLTTNDPRNPSISLEIVGDVTMALKLVPESLSLPSLSTSEPTLVSAKLFGFQDDKLEVLKHEFSDPVGGARIELTTRPLTADEIKTEKHARAGVELKLKFNPGNPIGPLTQNLNLTVKTGSERTIALPITGTVVGDLSFYGKRFDASSNTLNVGIVNRSVGLTVELFVLVKGPTRHDVKLSVGLKDPVDAMDVIVGDPTPLADGKAIKIPVKVKILKDAPVMNRLGNQQGKAAKFVLETTHEVSKQIPITVRFAIE